MSTVEIKDNVYWVGTIDWNLRDFHGYALARKGTIYNAFLEKDEKVTLFDTVSSRFLTEFLGKIRGLVEPMQIEYLVINHVEPDHSGCLVETVNLLKPKKIFCTAMGKEFMISHYHQKDWPYEVVKTGDKISLGRKTVQFIELKMLHWPDNMGCFLEEDKLLLSSDAFGHNWATSERFDDEVDFKEIYTHMANYFANIILPYSGNVLRALNTIEDLGWEIDMIAPDHGLIFRSHADKAIKAYKEFARQKAKAKAVIIYDTMWKSTMKLAHAIGEGLIGEGICIKIFDMKSCHHSDVMADVLDAQAVIVGSPTHNQGVLPYIAAMLIYMEGLKPQGKIGAAFGSYGWQKDSITSLAETLKRMNIQVIDSFSVRNVPTNKELKQCTQLGKKIADAIWERQKDA